MKRKRLSIKLILLLLALLVLSGCNDSLLISDFEVSSKSYREEGYFLPKRIVKFAVDITNTSGGKLEYNWTANGGQFLEKKQAEVQYITPNVPGEYTLFLTVKNQNGEQINQELSFTVKGNYPDQVSLESLKTTSVNSGVEINWSKYTGSDFYTYKILRSNNHFIDENAQVVATITNRSQTSYVDYNIKGKEAYSYQVMVINKDGYLSMSNEKMVETLAQQIKKLDLRGKISDIVISTTKAKLYLSDLQRQELLILDLNNYQVEKRINLGFKSKKMLLGPEERYLFIVASQRKKLVQLDLKDYSQQKFDFKSEIKDISLTEENIYLATAGENNLIKFNIKQGQIVEKFKVTNNDNLINASKLNVLNDQYLFIDKVFGESLIYNLNNLSQAIIKFDIGIVRNSRFSKNKGKNYLYVANSHHPLQVYGGITSGKISLAHKFSEISTPTDFAIDEEEKRIFVAVDKTIYVYSLANNKLLDEIEIQSDINRLAWSRKQDKLYLLTSQINGTGYNLMCAEID